MIIVQGAAPDEMQEAVLVHELSHALADQHFDMHRFLDNGPRSDESEAARLAVVEGQAMWIMLEATLNHSGQSLKTNSAVLELMLPAMRDMAAAQYPVFGKSPLYLKESLLFPYSAGLKFQQAVVEKMDREAFAAVLRDPPRNTHQIIHPELYLAHEVPATVEPPEAEPRDKTKKLTDGDIGEMDVHVWFEQYGSKEEADKLAPAWRAGRFELVENRATKKPPGVRAVPESRGRQEPGSDLETAHRGAGGRQQPVGRLAHPMGRSADGGAGGFTINGRSRYSE
jgi:hypothetical protein